MGIHDSSTGEAASTFLFNEIAPDVSLFDHNLQIENISAILHQQK